MKNNPFAVAQKYLDKPTEMIPENKTVLLDDDPVLPVEAWYLGFKELHRKVISESPNFDYGWLRANRPDLYRAIRGKENGLDALQEARLSEVMAIMREWRELILKAEFERRKFDREAGADIKK